jgi:hypothetical protein
MTYVHMFLYFQILDFLTTMVGFKMGASEASPVIRILMQFGPAAGVAASKILAFALAGLCVWLKKKHIVCWINYWYAGLVVWNLCVILMAGQPA